MGRLHKSTLFQTDYLGLIMDKYEYPIIMGRPITREEIMEGLWDAYKGLCVLEKMRDSTFVRYPDMETILKHIEKHGLPKT
jgi:hypothetical protein